MWEPILSEVDITQKYLHKKDLYLISVRRRFEIWLTFCRDEENHCLPTQWPKQQTLKFCEEMGIAIERRIHRRRRMPGEEAEDACLTLEQEVRREMPAYLDSLSQEIHQRFQQMSSICDRFQFLKRSELLREDTSDENDSARIRKLTSAYSEINSEELVMKVNRLRRFVKGMTESGDVINLLQWMAHCKLQETFPNLIIVIRIYLTKALSIT